jgi:hypothetical protein
VKNKTKKSNLALKTMFKTVKMKNTKIFVGLLMAALGMMSCAGNEEQKSNQEVQESTEVISENEPQVDEITIDEIDDIRMEVESMEISPIEVSTSKMRPKIKQKWSKIHFYVKDGIVVKIKTYPYPEISKRTEEFYANASGLALVVIEDNGEGEKGKLKSEIDKMYYFSNGELIDELSQDEEEEYQIRDSDGEELLSEFNEYISIYDELKK